MTNLRRILGVWGLIGCSLAIPAALSAASGCNTAQMLGVYNAQVTNVGFQGALTLPPTTTTATVIGFTSNPNSLSGNLPALGRYYFDGTGNIVGIGAATPTLPATNLIVGSYTVNVDCSASAKLTSGAAYDLFLAADATSASYVRTDATGNGEEGILRRGGSCVTLNYPGSYAYLFAGGTKQTDASGASGTATYSTAGILNLNGSGNFTMMQTQFSLPGGVQRSTAVGTYTIGGDCSVTLSFSTAADANSKNFVAPRSFRVLMVDAASGMISTQPDATTTLTGTLTAQ